MVATRSITAALFFAGAVGYLSAHLSAQGTTSTPPGTPPQGPGLGGGRAATPPPGRGGAGMGSGPSDMPTVDAAAADRGRRVWASECINCHGTQARGTDNGPNLVRSVSILKDRYGSELGPFLKKGHQVQSGGTSTKITDDQIKDLAHFLRQRINDTLRGSPIFIARNVLTGDPAAGEAFFNGPGKCTTCHQATSAPIAGIGGRFSPVDLQQRFLFPPGPGRGGGGRGGAGGAAAAPAATAVSPIAVRVTVTPAGKPAVSGVLMTMDDFMVTLRDADGVTQTFRRSPTLKVEKTDPLAAHRALLDTISDKNIHDVVAYLEKLK